MIGIAKILFAALWLQMVMVPTSSGVEVGDPLPDFTIQTFDGNTTSRTTLEGKPTLMIFWNTWCPVCMRELPEINRLAEEYGPRGLTILAINTAINDSERKARAYWKKHGYVFPVGFDHDFEVGTAFKVWGVPTVFLVDVKGVVRYKQPQLPGDMEERFKQLIVKE